MPETMAPARSLPLTDLSEDEAMGAVGAFVLTGTETLVSYIPRLVAILIDSEIKRIVTDCAGRARQMIETNLEKLHTLARALLERESLDGEEIARLLRVPPLTGAPAPA